MYQRKYLKYKQKYTRLQQIMKAITWMKGGAPGDTSGPVADLDDITGWEDGDGFEETLPTKSTQDGGKMIGSCNTLQIKETEFYSQPNVIERPQDVPIITNLEICGLTPDNILEIRKKTPDSNDYYVKYKRKTGDPIYMMFRS